MFLFLQTEPNEQSPPKSAETRSNGPTPPPNKRKRANQKIRAEPNEQSPPKPDETRPNGEMPPPKKSKQTKRKSQAESNEKSPPKSAKSRSNAKSVAVIKRTQLSRKAKDCAVLKIKSMDEGPNPREEFEFKANATAWCPSDREYPCDVVSYTEEIIDGVMTPMKEVAFPNMILPASRINSWGSPKKVPRTTAANAAKLLL